MLAKNLFENIGFSKENIKEYYHYRSLISDDVEKIAYDFMHSEEKIAEAIEKVDKLATDKVHTFTARLIFVVECTGYLEELYIKNNISLDILANSMMDLNCKVRECREVHNVFGTFVVEWYNGFLRMGRFAFGRLQFDKAVHSGEDIEVMGHTLKEGDFYLNCHIPSSGPLLPELCEDSFKRAYDYFSDRISGDILFIRCGSYLLYPPYESVFGVNSNTVKFARNFHIVRVTESDKFGDAWRIFGRDFEGNTDGFKTETTLQRRFVSYLNDKPTFGQGIGYALYDGQKIINNV